MIRPAQKLHHLHKLRKNLKLAIKLPGDVAECGVGYGGTACRILGWLKEYGSAKPLHLFDTFTGMPDLLTPEEWEIENRYRAKRLNRNKEYHPLVGGNLPNVDEFDEEFPTLNYVLHPGLFEETLPAFDRPLCFIHIDSDLYVSTCQALDMMNRLLVIGGRAIIHDYKSKEFPGVEQAISEKIDLNNFELIEHTYQATLIRHAI